MHIRNTKTEVLSIVREDDNDDEEDDQSEEEYVVNRQEPPPLKESKLSRFLCRYLQELFKKSCIKLERILAEIMIK